MKNVLLNFKKCSWTGYFKNIHKMCKYKFVQWTENSQKESDKEKNSANRDVQ